MEKRDYTKTTQLEDLSITDTESMMLPHELVDTDLPNHPYAVGTDNPIYDYYKPDMKTISTRSHNEQIYYPPGYENIIYKNGICKKKHHSKKSVRTKMKKASRRRNRK